MEACYSIWIDGTCHGRYSKKIFAEEVKAIYEEYGFFVKLCKEFMISRRYEVEDQKIRIRERIKEFKYD